ncbi:MAG: DUF4143 domain-containing protein, partial [Bacteroidales bacterium]|nr:DUF4143 domain-containing protein [Bacteroidales bacterium]
ALGNEVTPMHLNQVFEKKRPIGDALHRRWMRDLRLYMLIGGMPQAVNAYLEYNNLQQVDSVKREILKLYDVDFNKIDPSGRASLIFKNIPAQLSGNASRYMISSAIGSRRTENIDVIISEMCESRTINISYHCTDPNVGLSLHKSLDAFKIFIADTGLFVTLCFWDKDYTENVIYEKLLSDKLEANLGYIYENLAAQMFTAAGNKLFYYTFPSENEKHNYEVDFLLSRANKLMPVEVKSSGYKSHKSLDIFCEKFSTRIGDRVLLYTKDYRMEDRVQYIPMYFAGML